MASAAGLSWKGLTPQEYKKRLRLMTRDMRKIVVPPANKSAKEMRTQLVKDVRGTRQGAKLFGRSRRGGALGTLKMKRIPGRFSDSQRAYIAGGKLFGFGAWIAGDGGRTAAHVIRPKTKSALVFLSRKFGRVIRTPEVQHRGAPVKGYRLAEKNLNKQRIGFVNGVSKALVSFYSRVVAS